MEDKIYNKYKWDVNNNNNINATSHNEDLKKALSKSNKQIEELKKFESIRNKVLEKELQGRELRIKFFERDGAEILERNRKQGLEIIEIKHQLQTQRDKWTKDYNGLASAKNEVITELEKQLNHLKQNAKGGG